MREEKVFVFTADEIYQILGDHLIEKGSMDYGEYDCKMKCTKDGVTLRVAEK